MFPIYLFWTLRIYHFFQFIKFLLMLFASFKAVMLLVVPVKGFYEKFDKILISLLSPFRWNSHKDLLCILRNPLFERSSGLNPLHRYILLVFLNRFDHFPILNIRQAASCGVKDGLFLTFLVFTFMKIQINVVLGWFLKVIEAAIFLWHGK